MSRIGKRPVVIPAPVKVEIGSGAITATGPCGTMSVVVPLSLTVRKDGSGNHLIVEQKNHSDGGAVYGLTQKLISNIVLGVYEPWHKRLELVGVGFNASLKGSVLTLNVGFANPVVFNLPNGIKCETPDSTHINLSSPDKQLVGQIAADIRSVRPPEPYKGKGIRYTGEQVRKKAGKAFGS